MFPIGVIEFLEKGDLVYRYICSRTSATHLFHPELYMYYVPVRVNNNRPAGAGSF